MSASEAELLEQVVDTDRYPLSDPESPAWAEAVRQARQDLHQDGCSVLPNFIRSSLHETLQREGNEIAPHAHYDVEVVNAYNISVDESLPADHPARITWERGNAFVPRDRVPQEAIIHQLYRSELFQRFLADCFELPRVHELADPLAGLVLNVVRPGMNHPWHFDTNEFAVSLLTQEADEGGVFEYCPNIRSAQEENFDDVREALADRGRPRGLALRPGDLQLFRGRYALHRVTTVRGSTARHTAIFAYTEKPGVIGSVARTKQLFGRVLDEHLAAEGRAVRVDQLLD